MKNALPSSILSALFLGAGLSIAQAQETFEHRQSAIGLRVTSIGQLTLSSGSLSFFGLPAGQTSAPATVTLSNTGSETLTLDGYGVQGGDGAGGFFFAGTSCTEELEPGQSCTMNLYAVGQGVNRSGSFTILAGNAGTRTNRLQLFSSPNEDPALTPAAPPPAPEPPSELQANLSLSTTSVNFGSVATNTTETRQVLATNTGDGSLSWTAAPAVSGNAAFSAGATACGASLAAGQSCVTDVTFTPTAVGTFNGTLTFTSALANSPHQVSLVGTAFNPVSLAAATLPAATVGQAYSFDFKPLLNVSNEASPDRSLATWNVPSGTLPAGLSVNSATGVLSGTPSSANAGASFTVQGSYKNNLGQQVYTIVVNGVTLQVTQISLGNTFSCAVTPQGAALCWGHNGNGQLGDGTTVDRLSPVPVAGLNSGVVSVSGGDSHTCAITVGGAVWCWGYNQQGQVGDGTVANRLTPTPVTGLSSGVASVSAGWTHTCAVTNQGQALCWGLNSNGQLGDGTTTQRLAPTQVSGLEAGVASLATGNAYSCAVSEAGAAFCWGSNTDGRLGDGTTTQRLTPRAVSGLSSGVSSIAASHNHTCAVTTAGGALCWGNNGSGRLGDGTTTSRLSPTPVSTLTSGVAQIATGSAHTCATTTGGQPLCWGNGSNGRLGAETLGEKRVPTPVFGLSSGVSQISVGSEHTCVIADAGTAMCWGFNGNGRLGDGTTVVQRLVPTNVAPQ